MADCKALHLSLWKLIESNNATKQASFKSLKKFVLSLNYESLQHLILGYLKTVYPKQNLTTMTFKAAYKAKCVANHQQTENPQNLDNDILSSMNKYYGSKFKKTFIATVQHLPVIKKKNKIQKNKLNSNHLKCQNLLYLPVQLLSTSLSYLWFKELSQIEVVCKYFMYSSRTYPSLSHHSININHSTMLSLIRNQLNWENNLKLSRFKYIKIGILYYCEFSKRQALFWKKMLYQKIIKDIIKQNKSTLKILEIDTIRHEYGDFWNHGGSSQHFVLDEVLNDIDELLIEKLIWKKDKLKWHQLGSSLRHAISNISTKLPNLKELQCGSRRAPDDTYNFEFNKQEIIKFNKAALQCMIPIFSQKYSLLQSISLYFPLFNIFRKEYRICLVSTLVKNVTKLESLTIISKITVADIECGISDDSDRNSKNKSLKKLDLDFVCEGDVDKQCKKILNYFMSSCVNINDFSFRFSSKTQAVIGWKNVLITLPSLRKLKLYGMSSDAAMQICQTLLSLKVGKKINLSVLEIDIIYNKFDSLIMDNINKLINNHFKPLINGSNLKQLYIGFGRKHEVYCLEYERNNRGYINHPAKVKRFTQNKEFCCSPHIVQTHCDTIIDLLSLIPKSLKRYKIALNLGVYGVEKYTNSLYSKESLKIAKYLSELSTNRNERNLECIELNALCLEKKTRDFIKFWFGFDHNYQNFKNDYKISFV